MRLIACSRCNHHVRADEHACPHCQAPIRPAAGRFTQTTTALLLGLLPIACASTEQAPKKTDESKAQQGTEPEPKRDVGMPQPPAPAPDSVPDAAAYGAPPTDSIPEPEPTRQPPPEPVAEPEYGVPITETPE